jgi:formylglycine-generating enzyme required for sulfatase activity
MSETAPPLPVPRTTRDDLIEALRELRRETAQIENDPDFRGVNDPTYGERARDVLSIAKKLVALHLPNPFDDVVRGLEVLSRGVRLLRVPVRDAGDDPDERSRTYDTLRGAVGRMRTALDDALEAARAEYPDIAPVPRRTVPFDLEKVRALLGELDRFDAEVKRLAREEATAPGFAQQGELVRFFVTDMDLEIDLTRFVLRVNNVTLDLGAVVATVEAARDATFRFRANARDWFGRVTDGLLSGAETAAGTFREIVAKVRALGGAVGAGGDGEPEMVLIQPGAYVMGVSEAQQEAEGGSWDEHARPLHTVTIRRPFLLGKYPVTSGEYAAFATETGRAWEAPDFPQTDRHPAVNVSWGDAVAYAAWLSGRTGHRYRLPTEAEWEYACRAGTTTARYWGDQFDPTKANVDTKGTTEVGAYEANQWRLHDMLGNVHEWVADTWHDSYDGAPLDGAAWTSGGEPGRRVVRGGSWDINPGLNRAGNRDGDDAGTRDFILGFRVARTL